MTLSAVADRAGKTTLHVRVRSLLDGAEWEDRYPLAFRDRTITEYAPWIAAAPNWVDKKASEK